MWRASDGGWIYLVVDPARAGHTLVNLAVADLDAADAELRGRGLEAEAFETVGTAGRKAWYRDPDGNALVLIEVDDQGRRSHAEPSDPLSPPPTEPDPPEGS